MNKFKTVSRRVFAWRQISVALVCLAGLAMLISPLTNIQVAEAAGTITGTVYRDYNGNGTQDTGEIGQAGVIVKAYDASDALVGTATSTATGTYSLAHTGTGTIRVEFTIPLSACNLASTVDFPSTGGANYGTSVQFVTATQANVNFAFNNPAEFNNALNVANPPMAITQYVPGDPLQNTGATTDARTGIALDTFSYNSAGQIGSTGYSTPLGTVTADLLGTVWGLAYQKESGSLFASAVTKRHAGLGTLGTGGIYKLTATGVTNFVNVNSIGIPTGTVTRAATGNNSITANKTALSTDADAYDKVGKTGIGGMDLSDDGRFLYLMNLYDDPATTTVNERRLYRLNIGNPAVVPTAASVTAYDLPNPNCVRGVARPWAVKYYRGSVYTGIVCSGENAGTNTVGGASDINAYVYQMDAATGVFNATPVLTIPLNYAKGNVYNNEGKQWNPWTATFKTATSANASIYPEPILSDLEFDKDGTLILGFLDRNGMQTGFFQPDLTGAGRYEGFSGGDLLRAYKNPTGCAFQLESNGKEGAASAKAATTGAGNNQGIGGGEFYYQEALTGTHDETALGSLAFIPNIGGDDVLAGVYDPIRIRSGGVSAMNNTTGASDRDYELYFEAQSGQANTNGTFGKSVGLGDIEPLLAPAPLEIGNRVWNDANHDGIQEGGEANIQGVTLELYADFNNDGTPDGAVLATATTNASGNWYFNNANVTDGDPTIAGNQAGIQPNKNYIVRVAAAQFTGSAGVAATPLAGLTLTPNGRTGSGAAGLSDSDAVYNGGFAQINVPALVSGQNNHNLDIGFATPVYSLGNRVFNDANNNGVRDAAESGIAGATVNLYLDANNDNVADSATPTATTTTDANGYYRFDNLGANNYVVGVVIPTGFASSTVNAADPDNNVDNDDSGVLVVGTEVRSQAVTLGGQAEPLNEADLSASGQGNFDNQANMTLDFGFFQTASIGDLVFVDANRNGVQDAGEVGLGGVTVNLYDSTGTLVATTTTAVAAGTVGSYSFAGLAPGNYTVGFVAPAGYGFSPQTQGGNTTLDSDPNVSTGRTATITLVAGQPNTNVDAGLVSIVSLGNQVFNDTNNNGTRDAGELGIAGATVNLYLDANNDNVADSATPTATTTTDANGLYVFTGLTPNNYIVGVVTPAGYVRVLTNGGDADAAASDVDNNGVLVVGTEVRSLAVTLSVGGEPVGENPSNDATTTDNNSNLTLDFAFTPSYSLGNRVFNDANNNGVRDAAESGIAGATVNLYLDANNDNVADSATPTATTTTDANGYYRFDNLGANNYVVGVVIPTGFASSTVNAADPDNNVDNDDSGVLVVGTEVRSQAVTLGGQAEPLNEADLSASGQGAVDNQANMTLDFGFFQTASISGVAYNDGNRNSAQGAGETGISGATVRLLDSAGNDIDSDPNTPGVQPTTTTTGANGNYTFAGLAPGSYIVAFTTPAGTAGSAQAAGSTANPTTGRTAPITLTAGQSNTTTNTGFYPIVSVGNQVFNDANNNGVKDAGELGISGVTVRLLDSAGNDIDSDPNTAGVQPTTTTTDANGLYVFTGLAPGDYIVGVTIPTGFVPVATNGGDADTTVSDVDNNGVTRVGAEIRSLPITLSVGGEPVGENPSNDATTTDNNSNLTLDFAFTPNYSLGNRVFNDANNNGVRDAGETGIAGVTVRLLDSAGNAVDIDPLTAGVQSTVVTDANGYYRFDNLAAGDYIVEVVTPTGYASSNVNGGDPDNNTDNDDNGVTISATTVRSLAVTLGGAAEPTGETDLSASGQGTTDNRANMTVDFGFFQTASINGTVYNDANRNGAQGAGETGISGATVRLLDSAGNDIDSDPNTPGVQPTTTTTDANGNYTFAGLSAGTYIVAFTYPSGSSGSPQTAGSTANPTTGRTAPITLTAGQTSAANNAGVVAVVSVGNQVFNDANNNGVKDAGELGIAGVAVRLLDSAGNDIDSDPNTAGVQPTTTTTDANGLYVFTGLAPGDYIVGVTIPTGFVPVATNGGDADTTVSDVDNNGVTRVGAEIRSLPITLSVGGEPVGENPSNDATTTDNNSNLTLDFAFTPSYSLGNRIFFDTNNNGSRDAGELGAGNVQVELLDGSGNSIDSDSATAGVQPTLAVTDANGYYRFDNLLAGNFIVRITPTNFIATGDAFNALVGYQTSTATETNPNADVDNNDDGLNPANLLNPLYSTNGVSSGVVTLGGQAEPTAEGDLSPSGQGSLDNQSNLTVDFGFYRLSLSGTVWGDTNNNGILNAGEPGIASVRVRLFDANGVEIPVGADGVLGTADDAVGATAGVITDSNGNYAFTGLPAGSYTVRTYPSQAIAATTVATSADPTNNTDSDNNGVVVVTGAGGYIGSNAITLAAQSATTGAVVVNNATGTTSNPTLDFGMRTASTAAGVSLSGRVMTASGKGIARVQITLTDTTTGAVRTVMTGVRGSYQITDLEAGRSYIIEVRSKRYQFEDSTRAVSLTGDEQLNFSAYNQ